MDLQITDSVWISTDLAQLNIDVIHSFLCQSYWSSGIAREVVERTIQHSLCFGVYDDGAQIGFARVITDFATVAYLSDVFIVESHRGQGLGKKLVDAILNDASLQSVQRWLLATADAHGLYDQFGFKPMETPNFYMELVKSNACAGTAA